MITAHLAVLRQSQAAQFGQNEKSTFCPKMLQVELNVFSLTLQKLQVLSPNFHSNPVSSQC